MANKASFLSFEPIKIDLQIIYSFFRRKKAKKKFGSEYFSFALAVKLHDYIRFGVIRINSASSFGANPFC